VRILSVSTLLDTDNSARVGSIEGGTRLYIKIVGHDATMASNNSIFIGAYPCEIPGNSSSFSFQMFFCFEEINTSISFEGG